MSGQPARVFLGWERPFLDAAASWLIARFGDDLDGVVVALPGGRAARRLQDRLALAAPRGFRPPEVLTAGVLSDRLLSLPVLPASRLRRTLAWAATLLDFAPAELAAFLPQPPARGELEDWLALGSSLRRLHAALAAEGWLFDDVLGQVSGPRAEQERWRALAAVQQRYLARLAALGGPDPHQARLEAIRAGRGRAARAVVLAGVTDPSRLTRLALAAARAETTALVFAPAARAGAYDDLGAVRREAWNTADARLPLERADWRVVGRPAEQAEAVLAALRDLAGAAAPEQITIGVADEEVAPFCAARLAESGLATRDAAGLEVAATAPFRLLEAISAALHGRRFAAFAAAARHPELEPCLRRGGAASPRGMAEDLDRYAEHHFPLELDLAALAHGPRATAVAGWLRAFHELAGPLRGDAARPLPDWAPAIRELLERVYGERSFLAETEPDRSDAAALAALAGVLEAFLELPRALAVELPMSGGRALRLLLREAGAVRIPPSAHDGAIELLGWLELALDDAPHLILTGFQEGRVPEATGPDPFLPDSLRQRLGLPDRALRLARDAAALEAILHSRPRPHLISGRRSRDGDPLLPSRLAFLCAPEELPARVAAAFGELPAAAPAPPAPAPLARRLPRREPLAPPRWMRVTDFRAFLASPYGYYLERQLGLASSDDEQPELDALAFGTLAHAVLQRFGAGPQRHSTDPREILAALEAALAEESRQRFGGRAAPAVRLQLEQLRARLRHFAGWQARNARDGWRIEGVELEVDETRAWLEVDGERMGLRAKIDRLDRREGSWRIYDYKTGDTAATPAQSHRAKRSGVWKDLQLPLYAHLAPALGAAATLGQGLEVGYLALARDATPSGPQLLAAWTAEDLVSALDAAREVVRAVRRGACFALGDHPPRDPLLAGIAGIGLLAAEEDEA